MMLVCILFVLTHCLAPRLLQFVSVTRHANIHRCDMFQHLSAEVSLLCLEVMKSNVNKCTTDYQTLRGSLVGQIKRNRQ